MSTPRSFEEEQSDHHLRRHTLTQRLRTRNVPWNASDSVASAIQIPYEKDGIIADVAFCCQELLRALLIDVDNDPNAKGTALRMAKAYVDELMVGRYSKEPRITVFPNAKLDEVYTVGPIAVKSLCSHHMLPFTGSAWVGVLPGTEVFGLSKFSRVVDWFARRPQLQENLTVELADYLERHAKPKGIAVVIRAEHSCMTCRGVNEHNAAMTTSVLRGTFRKNPAARSEFFELANINA